MEQSFSQLVLDWYDQNKRVLSFRGTKDPYRVWLSEIMLQQTRTVTAEGYYERFLRRFPDVCSLAQAPEEEVLKLWEGLGYYSRARNLLKAARVVTEQYGGQFPADVNLLRRLPGVGPYTAAAVASIAFGLAEPAIDGNLTRVLARTQGIREDVTLPSVQKRLTETARSLIPSDRPGDFNQALMDLGAGVCVPGTPDCENCPLRDLCDARAAGDMEQLPLQPQKAPPRAVRLNVLIILWEDRVYLTPRKEGLLNGLYVFYLTEDTPSAALRRLHLSTHAKEAGNARHVFTHRVWEMKLYVCRVQSVPKELEPCFYTLDEMNALPVPTAMRAAKAVASDLLRGETPA